MLYKMTIERLRPLISDKKIYREISEHETIYVKCSSCDKLGEYIDSIRNNYEFTSWSVECLASDENSLIILD